jgi:hypothetical protein
MECSINLYSSGEFILMILKCDFASVPKLTLFIKSHAVSFQCQKRKYSLKELVGVTHVYNNAHC